MIFPDFTSIKTGVSNGLKKYVGEAPCVHCRYLIMENIDDYATKFSCAKSPDNKPEDFMKPYECFNYADKDAAVWGADDLEIVV